MNGLCSLKDKSYGDSDFSKIGILQLFFNFAILKSSLIPKWTAQSKSPFTKMFCPSQNVSMAEISCRSTNFYYEKSLFEIHIIGRFLKILRLKMLLLSEYK